MFVAMKADQCCWYIRFKFQVSLNSMYVFKPLLQLCIFQLYMGATVSTHQGWKCTYTQGSVTHPPTYNIKRKLMFTWKSQQAPSTERPDLGHTGIVRHCDHLQPTHKIIVTNVFFSVFQCFDPLSQHRPSSREVSSMNEHWHKGHLQLKKEYLVEWVGWQVQPAVAQMHILLWFLL